MNALDWGVIGVYLIAMITMSYFLGKKQKDPQDYYLAGKSVKWWPLGLSTMATQCSTNSLLGAPAFVAFTVGGGLLWLQYELAVPLAMVFIMAFIIPFYRKNNVISIYEYLEPRFGVGTRTLLSVLFQFLRAFSTGVTVYGISIILEQLIGLPFWMAVLILGVVTVVYDSLGGMEAVVYSDVIQMIILYGGILIAGAYAVHLIGGFDSLWANFEGTRKQALDFSTFGFSEGKSFGFWPMLVGGFFLYCSYYGCDQSQVQRELSAPNRDGTNLSLAFNGFTRFPLVLTYCFLGVAIGAFAQLNPSFLEKLVDNQGNKNFNLAVPVFVLEYLPHGVIGIIMIALFAAAMSSLDSTINSLSATSMQDLVLRFWNRTATEKQQFFWAKGLTVFWGALCCFFSFFVGNVSSSIIESINKIGSLANGPILATFILGIFTKRANGFGTVIGILAGYLLNTCLWKFAPNISWLWWNVTGFVATFTVGYLISLMKPQIVKDWAKLTYSGPAPVEEKGINWGPVYWGLGIYTLLMIGILAFF